MMTGTDMTNEERGDRLNGPAACAGRCRSRKNDS